MPRDEAALAELRQANERRAADYRRWLVDIDRRLKALEDRELVDDIERRPTVGNVPTSQRKAMRSAR
jgi:hypothetical protein